MAEKAMGGDLCLMTEGTKVVGLGVFAGDPSSNRGYEWRDDLPLLGGSWDLCHIRRVKWLPEPEFRKLPVPPPALKGRPSRAAQVWSEEIVAWTLQNGRGLRERLETKALPSIDTDRSIHLDQLPEFMRNVTSMLQDYWDRIEQTGWDPAPSENEGVALAIVPFLRALGWRPEQMALEWNRIDLAVFKSSRGDRKDLALIVEAKRPGTGPDLAAKQADRYRKIQDRRDIPLLTSDGFNYRLYEQVDDGSWSLFVPDLRESAIEFVGKLIELGLVPACAE
ncbi:MAG: hypothetical protein U0R24_04095 [Solirubrobacterales bacterium]